MSRNNEEMFSIFTQQFVIMYVDKVWQPSEEMCNAYVARDRNTFNTPELDT